MEKYDKSVHLKELSILEQNGLIVIKEVESSNLDLPRIVFS